MDKRTELEIQRDKYEAVIEERDALISSLRGENEKLKRDLESERGFYREKVSQCDDLKKFIESQRNLMDIVLKNNQSILYIKYFSLSTFYRNRDSPIQVTAYRTGLQAHIQPAFTLSVYIGAPFFMIFKNPFTQPSFVFVQWQIPMFGFTHHWFTATDSTFRIDQVGRRK